MQKDTDEESLNREVFKCYQHLGLLERERERLGTFIDLIHSKNIDIKKRVYDPESFDRFGDPKFIWFDFN